MSISMITIALYDTLGPDTCAYISNQSEYLYGYYSILMTYLDQTYLPISLTRVSISMVTIALYD